ncbi:MAG: hypothetical protein V1659_04355 [Candidatus Woesearchaeota archaeon]
MEKRGRPLGSQIRQNIIEILYIAGKTYGYDLYKSYVSVFPKITLRVVYYHLKKGVSLKEFKLEKIESEHGDYSWGDRAEKHYYSLGENAKPSGSERVRKYFEGMKKDRQL